MDKNRVAIELVRLAKQLVSTNYDIRVFAIGGGKSSVTGVPPSLVAGFREEFRTLREDRKSDGTYSFQIPTNMTDEVEQWLKENEKAAARRTVLWDKNPGEMFNF